MSKKNENSVYYTKLQLMEILNVQKDYETKVFMTNEIFDDLLNCSEFKCKISNIKQKDNTIVTHVKEANVNHIAFAFSFVFIVSYLYRYAKYIYTVNDEELFIDEETIYQICNTSPSSRGKQGVSYITKKNGLLERLGYNRKTKVYPIDYHYLDNFDEVVIDYKLQMPEFVDFILNEDREVTHEISGKTYTTVQKSPYPKRTINYPIKAFHLFDEAEQDNYYNGYFYHVNNTTKIDINVFIHCMSIGELGTKGFYLYCFLKSKCDYFPNHKYIRSIKDFSKDSGIGVSTLSNLLTALEEYNMITNSHNTFITDLSSDKIMPANTYTVKPCEKFTSIKQKIDKRKVMRQVTYDALHGQYLGDDDMDEIPF